MFYHVAKTVFALSLLMSRTLKAPTDQSDGSVSALLASEKFDDILSHMLLSCALLSRPGIHHALASITPCRVSLPAKKTSVTSQPHSRNYTTC